MDIFTENCVYEEGTIPKAYIGHFRNISKLSYNKEGLGIKDPMKNVENRFKGSLAIACANLLECDWDKIQLIQRQIIDNIRKHICEHQNHGISKW
ncbi:hypothetical protein GJ496_002240 [Pomphorhynchus laevis]|nr:hypothetical protein GJ496_002240 [Pomphorhynchus laevis]